MSITHDTATRSHTAAGTTADFNWSHTASASAKGAVVAIVQGGSSSDTVNGVTYGGVAMSRLRFDAWTGTEPGAVYLYFLGDSLPGGTQTVAVDSSGAATKLGYAATVTATLSSIAADVSNGGNGTIVNPSLTLNYTDSLADWDAYYVIYTSVNAPVTTVESGSTHVFGNDQGSHSGMFARKPGAGGTSTTSGYTLVSSNVAHAGVVLKEVAAAHALAANIDAVVDAPSTLTVPDFFPQVASEISSSQETATTTHTVSMPSGSGDRLLMAMSYVGEPTLSGTDIAEWDPVGPVIGDDIPDETLHIYYRDDDPAGSTISVTSSISVRSAHHVWRITDFDPATPPAIAHTDGVNQENPPALNPAGWDAEDTLWIAIASACNDGAATNFTTFPTGYTGTGQRVTAGTAADGVGLGWARRENTVASEDPSTFGGSPGRVCTATLGIRQVVDTGAVELAANVDVVSDVQPALSLTLPLATNVDSVVDSQPLLGLAIPLAGTSDAVVSQSGLLGLAQVLATSVDIVQDQSGTLGLALSLAAVSDAVVSQSGDLSVTLAGLEAVVDIVVSQVGTVNLALPLAASSDAVVSQEGFLRLSLPLAATSDAVVDQVSTARLALPLAVISDAVVDVLADLGVQGETLSAFVDAVVDLQSNLRLALPLAASSDAVVDQQSLLRLSLGLGSTLDVVTSQQGTLSQQLPLGTQIDAVVDQTADLDVFLPALLQVAFGVLRRRYGAGVLERRYAAGEMTRGFGQGDLARRYAVRKLIRRYRAGEIRREP